MNRLENDLDTAMKPKRRPLRFTSLAQVMPEVERLLAGHALAGQWSLGLMCHHLKLAIDLSMDGFPSRAPWILRRTAGPLAGWFSLTLGWIPRGMPAPGWRVPTEKFDAQVEAANLRAAIARFDLFSGKLDEHPVMGCFSRSQWERFHCIHCAHHLSFAVPLADSPECGQPLT